MKKYRLVLQIILAVAFLITIIVASAVLDSTKTKYATKLALDQMEIEGSLDYAIYHEIVMQWEAIKSVAAVFLVIIIALSIIDVSIQKIRSKKEQEIYK